MIALGPDAKDALAHVVPDASHCRDALTRALAFYGRDSDGSTFVTYRNAVARLFWSLLEERKAAPISARSTRRLRAGQRFEIAIPLRLRGEPARPTRRCDQAIELRAAFLLLGGLSAGARGYHLDFAPGAPATEHRLAALLRTLELAPRSSTRRRKRILYFKDFQTIVDLLARIGAHEAVLTLEDVRALRETKNRVHRLVNTETANLGRAARAAAAQRSTIEYLERAYGVRRLSPPLREIASLRRRYPGESLSELGRRCDPPVGKPTVARRLAALAQLAARLRAQRQGRPPAGR